MRRNLLSRDPLKNSEKLVHKKAEGGLQWQTPGKQQRADLGFTAVLPEDIGLPTWPSPLAHSDFWTPAKLLLHAVNVGSQGHVRLELQHDEYRPCSYSKGPAAGRYLFAEADLNISEKWSEERLNRYTPVKWITSQPPPGSYQVYVVITESDLFNIELLEGEHIADFKLAWELSVGVAVEYIKKVPVGPLDSALGILTDNLIGAGKGYVIPKTPDDIGEWGKRLKQIYLDLAGMSSKRDKALHHSPIGYSFSRVKTAAQEIDIRYVCPPLRPGSENYVKAAEVKVAFDFKTYAEYKASRT